MRSVGHCITENLLQFEVTHVCGQALDAERSARKRLEAEIALERAESGSLSSAHSGVPTDTESDADVETSTRGRQSRLRRSSRSQRPSGSPLADYVLQGFPHVCEGDLVFHTHFTFAVRPVD